MHIAAAERQSSPYSSPDISRTSFSAFLFQQPAVERGPLQSFESKLHSGRYRTVSTPEKSAKLQVQAAAFAFHKNVQPSISGRLRLPSRHMLAFSSNPIAAKSRPCSFFFFVFSQFPTRSNRFCLRIATCNFPPELTTCCFLFSAFRPQLRPILLPFATCSLRSRSLASFRRSLHAPKVASDRL